MRTALSVLMPLLVLAGWVIQLALAVSTGLSAELRIAGYDPRDLLAGHYLTYEVDYGTSLCNSNPTNKTIYCICLNASPDGISTAQWHGACADKPNCQAWIRGACEQGRFVAGIERYYVSEDVAQQNPVIPPSASIRIRLDGKGSAKVETMLVEGLPLTHWLNQQEK